VWATYNLLRNKAAVHTQSLLAATQRTNKSKENWTLFKLAALTLPLPRFLALSCCPFYLTSFAGFTLAEI